MQRLERTTSSGRERLTVLDAQQSRAAAESGLVKRTLYQLRSAGRAEHDRANEELDVYRGPTAAFGR